MATFIIGLLLVIISAISESIMDKIQFHFKKSVFSGEGFNQLFWNPQTSWKNKWDSTLKKPKFFLSTTMLVFLTDAWHLFKFVRNTALFIGLPVMCLSGINILIVMAAARIAYGLAFTLMFDRILVK